jgi:uncharacterized membrane protein required for colicin V production
MGIDILFIIMASFGFYFGYAFGLIRVVIFLVALIVALGIAMYVTPSTTLLIKQVLSVESPFLPFVAFLLTLVGVMLVARIVFKLMEETIKSKQVNQMTQGIGGFMMAGIFIFLYSVLVTFFSAAHVIKPDQSRENSFFFPYIEQIPVYSKAGIKMLGPYMKDFFDYMDNAFDRLENGDRTNSILEDLEHAITEDDFSLDSLNMKSDSLNWEALDSLTKDIKVDTSKMLEDTTSTVIMEIKRGK